MKNLQCSGVDPNLLGLSLVHCTGGRDELMLLKMGGVGVGPGLLTSLCSLALQPQALCCLQQVAPNCPYSESFSFAVWLKFCPFFPKGDMSGSFSVPFMSDTPLIDTRAH